MSYFKKNQSAADFNSDLCNLGKNVLGENKNNMQGGKEAVGVLVIAAVTAAFAAGSALTSYISKKRKK